MLPLAHLGIGSKLVSPWTNGLSRRFVLLGTILPDLLDKPLYYGMALVTGRHGAEIGLISGTRTFAHTALFLIAITGLALVRHSKILAALALGIASHLLLDALNDQLPIADTLSQMGSVAQGPHSALLWPFLGWNFPALPFHSWSEHLGHHANLWMIGAEFIGLALLSWEWWKDSRQNEILGVIQKIRQLRKRRNRAIHR